MNTYCWNVAMCLWWFKNLNSLILFFVRDGNMNSLSFKSGLHYWSGLKRLFPFLISWDAHFGKPAAMLLENQMLQGENCVGILATAQTEILMKSQRQLPNIQVKEFLSQRSLHVFSAKGQLVNIYIVGHYSLCHIYSALLW